MLQNHSDVQQAKANGRKPRTRKYVEVQVVLTVHDEIVLECPQERVAFATQILKDAMVQACREYLKVVHIPDQEPLGFIVAPSSGGNRETSSPKARRWSSN